MDMRQIRKAVALCDSLFCFIKIALSNRKCAVSVVPICAATPGFHGRFAVPREFRSG